MSLRPTHTHKGHKETTEHPNGLKFSYIFIYLHIYKKKEKIFPTYWIPEKDLENSKKTKEYKTINQ